MVDGWTIRVTMAGQPVRLYAVAETDPKSALMLAQRTLGTAPNGDRLETVEQLSGSALRKLGVKLGQIKDVTGVAKLKH